MIEIFVLIYVCRKMGESASRKGLPPGRWKLYTVLAWILAEVLGYSLGKMLFGTDNWIGLLLFAFACAFGGYLLVRAILEKMPDSIDDDINHIGRE